MRPRRSGPSLRLRGELRGADGTADLREAVDLLAGSRAVLEAARARLALGRCAEVADDEAVPLLQAALSTARACGARAVAREAEEALAAVGLKSSSSPPGHPGTPRS